MMHDAYLNHPGVWSSLWGLKTPGYRVTIKSVKWFSLYLESQAIRQ